MCGRSCATVVFSFLRTFSSFPAVKTIFLSLVKSRAVHCFPSPVTSATRSS